jgi:membrane-associated HD superfamily phosphohydrolase
MGATIMLCVLLPGRPSEAQDAAADQLHIDAFRMGASIYIGTYLLGSSFDYRLMFLLFTIPQLTQWLSNSDSRLRRVARITFACAMYSLWSMFLSRLLNAVTPAWVQLLFDAVAKAVLVGGLTYLFVLSAPQWVPSYRRAFRRSTQPALSSSS